MKNTFPIILLLAATALPVSSDVIKCKLSSGKIVYQQTPCPSSTVSKQKVEIEKADPLRLEKARIELKAWQAEQEAREAKENEDAKLQREEMDRQETINALNRNAIAQEQQAAAAKRQAEALEWYNQQYHYDRFSLPYYSNHFDYHHNYFPPENKFEKPDHHNGHDKDKDRNLEGHGWKPSN